MYFSKRLKILRRRSGIPGRKQINLANYSVTGKIKEECTYVNFPQYFGSKGSFYRKVIFRYIGNFQNTITWKNNQNSAQGFLLNERLKMPGTRYCNTENMAKLFWNAGESSGVFSYLVWEIYDMFIFSNWKINRKEKILRKTPSNKMKIKREVFFTKGLSFPKENEIFKFQNSMKQKIIFLVNLEIRREIRVKIFYSQIENIKK